MSSIEAKSDQEIEEQAPVPEVEDPPISCKNCIHKDVCYFLTQLHTLGEGMKCSKICELPYSPNILAIKCSKFESNKKVDLGGQ